MLWFQNSYHHPAYCEKVILNAGGKIEKGIITFPENKRMKRRVEKAILSLIEDWDYSFADSSVTQPVMENIPVSKGYSKLS